MKNILTIMVLLLCVSCSAQIIPVENLHDYPNDIPDGAYIKDVNNLFDKYVGIWEGEFDGKHYTFHVTKETDSFLDITADKLKIRYRIEENSTGNLLVDTTPTSTESYLIITGSYLDKNGETYVLYYQGIETDCGRNGDVFINVQSNPNQMSLLLVPKGEMYVPDCPGGSVYQILPTGNGILLDKQ